MSKKLVLVAAILTVVFWGAFAAMGDLSLYTSMTTAGKTSGGLRLDLGSGFVTDGTLAMVDDTSGTSKTTYEYWADVYYGVWGLAVSGTETSVASIALMYALEQPVNDKISLGIAVNLVTMGGGSGVATQFVNNYDIYAVLAL